MLEFREMVALDAGTRSANDLQQLQDRYTGPFVATVDFWISEEQSKSPGHTLTGRRDEERYG